MEWNHPCVFEEVGLLKLVRDFMALIQVIRRGEYDNGKYVALSLYRWCRL